MPLLRPRPAPSLESSGRIERHRNAVGLSLLLIVLSRSGLRVTCTSTGFKFWAAKSPGLLIRKYKGLCLTV